MESESSQNTPQSRHASPRKQRLATVRARALLELTALAEDVAAHLRRHSAPTVRLSAALLLTASLAACATPTASSRPSGPDGNVSVRPLDQDVNGGLPSQPGRYDVRGDEVFRDRRGIYEFTWLDQQQQPHNAYTSRLRLADGSKPELEIPSDRSDPVLYLPKDTPIRIVEDSQAAQQPNSSVYAHHDYPWTSSWLPFAAGALLGRLTAPSGPAYYNPPLGNYNAGTSIRGGTASAAPAPPQDRVIGLRSGVSGQSGGTGSGSAVTNKTGSSAGAGSSSGTGSTTNSSGGSGAGSSSSGTGASSGQSGGQGSGSAVGGKSGSSGGGGVTSPSSGGFSGGKGSSGGSSGGGSSSS